MADAGYVCLLLAVFLGCLGSCTPWAQRITDHCKGPWLMVLIWGQTALVWCAWMILLIHTMTSQDTWRRIAHAWGTPKGSFLMWLVAVYSSLWFWARTSILPHTQRDQALQYGQWVGLSFLICALMSGHPFDTIMINGNQNLHPLLDHPYMMIHPPILYLGYSTSLPLLSLGFLTMQETHVQAWLHEIKVWGLISWGLLTTGIALGSAWAYTQLGWGGWWFWDPVENAALIPWLVLTGLMHTPLYAVPVIWVKRLVMIPFMMVQTGLWGIRSGLWSSVHSFAQESSWRYSLGGVTLGVIFLSLYHMVRRTPHQTRPWVAPQVILMLLISVILALATWYPVAYEQWTYQTTAIDVSFYHQAVVPLCLLAVWGAALGPLIRSHHRTVTVSLTLGASLLAMLVITLSTQHVASILAWGGAVALLTSLCCGCILTGRHHHTLGSLLIHTGLAVSVLGMAADPWQQVQTVFLRSGNTLHHRYGDIMVHDLTYTQTPQGAEYSVLLSMTARNQKMNVTQATLKYHPQQDMWTSHAGIFHFWRGDILMIPEKLMPDHRLKCTAHDHPLISLIWLGAFMMIGGACGHLYRIQRKRP